MSDSPAVKHSSFTFMDPGVPRPWQELITHLDGDPWEVTHMSPSPSQK